MSCLDRNGLNRVIVNTCSAFVCTYVLSSGMPCRGQTAATELPMGLRLAREAALSQRQMLTSGKGVGIYWHRRQHEKDERPAPVEQAKITTYFKDRKYRVEMDYVHKAPSHKRRIVICDGSVLASSILIDGEIQKTHGFIAPAREKLTDPVASGFPWDLSDLSVLKVDVLIQKKTIDEFKITQLDRQSFEVRYYNGLASFELSEGAGFNVGRFRSWRKDVQEPVTIKEGNWQCEKGVWFLQSFLYQLDLRFRGNALEQWEMKYDKFEPNVEISDRLFTLDSLELEEKSRILDLRPGAGQSEYFFTKKETSVKRLDDIVSQAKSLPAKASFESSQVEYKWPALIGAILLTLLGMLLFVRRRRRLFPTNHNNQ